MDESCVEVGAVKLALEVSLVYKHQGIRRTLRLSLTRLASKVTTSHLDEVSTGSGSDLVSDQPAIFPNDF